MCYVYHTCVGVFSPTFPVHYILRTALIKALEQTTNNLIVAFGTGNWATIFLTLLAVSLLIKDFTELVQREASEACDPVYYDLFPTKQREDVKGANFHTVAYAPCDIICTNYQIARIAQTTKFLKPILELIVVSWKRQLKMQSKYTTLKHSNHAKMVLQKRGIQ